MKSLKFVTFVTIGLIACFAATGCKKKMGRTTPLPKEAVTSVPNDGTGGTPATNGLTAGPSINPSPLTDTTTIKPGEGGLTPASSRSIEGRPQDREKFKPYTVYFDFDRSVVKSSEASKVDAVASGFKNCDPNSDLLIEGHCDERGTPEYNRALGERRAFALREYLIKAGINPERIHTVSFGKDQPAALGHDDASYSKNRRGEFVYVLPK
jgi:peptidoglycan-associated lipoprotein